jgi:hypothetical protein
MSQFYLEEIFDIRLASIRLLGRDMARIADPDTLRMVGTILDGKTFSKRFFPYSASLAVAFITSFILLSIVCGR